MTRRNGTSQFRGSRCSSMRASRFARRPPHLEATLAAPTDFSSAESQRVLTAAACAVARELGRAAARERFAEWIGTEKGPK
jgi:hypothetical protein